MRKLQTKYDGTCAKCGSDLHVGDDAMYEKSMGIFCVGCEPITIEEIRAFRQAKADRKADRIEGWAQKREEDAAQMLNSHPSYRHDWAFITQPGHIPARARMIKSDDRAYESLGKAREMRSRADNIRHVTVKGDAERKRQAEREALDSVLHKGSRVHDFCFGDGTIISVHKKSYRIEFDGKTGEKWKTARDKSYVKPIENATCAAG